MWAVPPTVPLNAAQWAHVLGGKCWGDMNLISFHLVSVPRVNPSVQRFVFFFHVMWPPVPSNYLPCRSFGLHLIFTPTPKLNTLHLSVAWFAQTRLAFILFWQEQEARRAEWRFIMGSGDRLTCNNQVPFLRNPVFISSKWISWKNNVGSKWPKWLGCFFFLAHKLVLILEISLVYCHNARYMMHSEAGSSSLHELPSAGPMALQKLCASV